MGDGIVGGLRRLIGRLGQTGASARRGAAFTYALLAVAGGLSTITLTVAPGQPGAGTELWRLTPPAATHAVATTMARLDDTPARVLLVPRRNLQPGEAVTANTIRLSGITVPVGVAVSDGAEVSIQGGPFTAGPAVAQSGQPIVVRARAPAAGETATITLTTGTVASQWQLTSVAVPGYTHQTLYGPWGACDAAAPCDGMGTQTREVLCLRSDGRFVPMSDCAATLGAVESRACPSPAGTTACVPMPALAIGTPTQFCAAGSSVRSTCSGFTCPAPYEAQDGVCVSTRQSLPVLSLSVPDSLHEDQGPLVVTLTADYPALTPITLPVRLSPLSAARLEDLEGYGSGALGTLTLPVGATSTTLTLAIADDDLSEPDELLVLEAGPATGGASLAPGGGLLQTLLRDDDARPAVSLALSTDTLAEGATATLTGTLDRDRTVDLTIPLVLTGAEGGVATLSAPALVFPAGSRSATVGLSAIADDIDRRSRTITVALAPLDPQLALPGSPSAVSLTLDDDDQPSFGVTGPGTVPEGDGTATHYFTVTRSGATEFDFELPYTLMLGAVGDANLAAPAGTGTQLLTFPAGVTTRTVAITVTGDQEWHGPGAETATLTLLPVAGAAIEPAVATLTVADDEGVPVVRLSGATTPLAEGASRTLTVSLSPVSSQAVRVPLVLSAPAGVASLPAHLDIPARSASASVTLAATADSHDRADATVTVALGAVDPAQGSVDPAAGQLTLTILDDDQPSFAVSGPGTVMETDGEVLRSFTVTRTGSTDFDFQIPYTATVTAVNAPNLVFVAGEGARSLAFPAGVTSRTIDVRVIGDDVFGGTGTERATVTLGAVSGAELGTATATLTLTEDEGSARSCLELRNHAGMTTSGQATITPDGAAPMTVWCDQETDGGGWIVVQRRFSGNAANPAADFYRPYAHYAAGFTNSSSSFWLGNDNLARITNSTANPWKLRVDLTYERSGFPRRTAFAHYDSFRVGAAATGYRLSVSGYTGTAGDSLTPHNGFAFSTYDAGPSSGCAVAYGGAWWYNSCHSSNLNGEWEDETDYADGLAWYTWLGHWRSNTGTELKIRETGAAPTVRANGAPTLLTTSIPAAQRPLIGHPYSFQLLTSDPDGDPVWCHEDDRPTDPAIRVTHDCKVQYTPTLPVASFNVAVVDDRGGRTVRTLSVNAAYAAECNEYFQRGITASGTYLIDPDANGTPTNVYCDMSIGDGFGYTLIASSYANTAGSGAKPFNVGWSTVVNSGVGSPGVGGNYFMAMNDYAALASAATPVVYRWFAKSGQPSDPYLETVRYTDHRLEGSTFIFRGTRAYARTAYPVYDNQRLVTIDNGGSGCPSSYGSFGWYTGCHDAHFWSTTEERGSRGGTAVSRGYRNWGPDAAGAYNTWYHLKILVRRQ